MTILTDCHSQNSVIPTEKPLGFDEESRVCNSQSRKTQSINCRSSRRSFHSLLRMTGLRDCYFEIYITIPLRMTNLWRRCSSNPVIPTERTKGATRNLQSILRSQGELEVPTVDPRVASLLDGSFRILLRIISKSLD